MQACWPLIPLQWLWRYAKKSVALRIRYLITSPKGADSNSVLVQDIPGIGFGTQAERAKSVAPKFIANKVGGLLQSMKACKLSCTTLQDDVRPAWSVQELLTAFELPCRSRWGYRSRRLRL